MNYSRFTKKAAVGMLTAAMVFGTTAGMGVTAWADEPATTPNYIFDTTKTSGKITIHKYEKTQDNGTTEGNGDVDATMPGENTPIKGAVFGYQKVADVVTYDEYTTNDGKVSVNTQLLYRFAVNDDTKALLKALGLFDGNAATNNKVVKVGTETTKNKLNDTDVTGDDADTTKYLYFTSNALNTAITTLTNKSAIEKYMVDQMTANKAQTAKTDEAGKAELKKGDSTALDLGLYLCAETAFPFSVTSTTNPFFVALPLSGSNTGTDTTWNYDVHVYPKNQVDLPTIDKLVKDKTGDTTDADAIHGTYADIATVSEGDIIDYAIVVKVPANDPAATDSDASKYTNFVIRDKMKAGLTFVANSVKINFVEDLAGTKTAGVYDADFDSNLPKADWTDKYEVKAQGKSETADEQIVIKVKDDGLTELYQPKTDDYADGHAGQYMIITYQAKVTDAAVLGDSGNDNEATLFFSRANMDLNGDGVIDKIEDTDDDGFPDKITSDTTEITTENWPQISDTAKVFTYGIDLTKELQENTDTDKFSDVKFTLQNMASTDAGDEYYIVAEETAENPGVYNVTGITTDAAKATEFSPNADGALKINGLEADTYTLTEVQTAQGYSLLKNTIEIVITPTSQTLTPDTLTYASGAYTVTKTDSGKVSAAAATVDGNAVTMTASGASNNAIVPLTVVNTKSFTLPQTGGAGVLAIVMVGALTFSGAVIFLKKKARE